MGGCEISVVSVSARTSTQLTRNAGVIIPEEECGIREIERFQRYLAVDNIAIVVYNFSTFGHGEKPMYDGIALLASLGREPALRLNIMYMCTNVRVIIILS